LKSGHSKARPNLLVLVRVNKCIKNDIKFRWVPAHVAIQGNETADQLAKSALNHSQIDITVGLEISNDIKKYIDNKW
jgi:ribonuclease HI